jgi:hypothetical protein
MGYPAKHRDQFYQLLLIYILNQNSWKCSDETDVDAFDQLQRALRRLKHEPFSLTTEMIEDIANNHEDWMTDLMEMNKFNGIQA